jgi:hypothetical protein
MEQHSPIFSVVLRIIRAGTMARSCQYDPEAGEWHHLLESLSTGHGRKLIYLSPHQTNHPQRFVCVSD